MKSRFFHAYFTHFSLSQQHGFYIDYNILHGDLGNYGNVRKTVNNPTHIDIFFFSEMLTLFCYFVYIKYIFHHSICLLFAFNFSQQYMTWKDGANFAITSRKHFIPESTLMESLDKKTFFYSLFFFWVHLLKKCSKSSHFPSLIA